MFLLLPLIAFGLYINTPTESVQQETESTKVQRVVDKKQLQCLADNIYYEAGGEPTEGKAAVARVVLNRVSHGFATTPCKVVYQTTTVQKTDSDDETFWVKMCQFSWVCEGKSNPNRNSHRYQSSLQVAYDVLAYDMYKDIIPKTVLFFHNTSVKNSYPHEVVARIGNHIFYKKKPVNGKRKQNRDIKVTREGRVQSENV
jgi:spore germination cell wall hydrolase CwlJ-like protein